MKKFIAGFGLTVLGLSILGSIIYGVGYKPLVEAYQSDGWIGVVSALIAFLIIGTIFWLIIKFVDWAIDVLGS